MSDFAHLNLNKCIDTLVYGTTVKMIKNKKKNKIDTPSIFVFSICESNFNELQWIHKHKNKLNKIDLGLITSISHYYRSSNEKSFLDYNHELVLVIMYGKNKKLTILFDDYHIKEHFWCGLRHFMDKHYLEEVTL